MPADRWFRAEYCPQLDPDLPVVLHRRGDPIIGVPSLDCWRDRGSNYHLSVADAIALRDSLTAAIDAATKGGPDAR